MLLLLSLTNDAFQIAFDVIGANIDVGICLVNTSPWYLFHIISDLRILLSLDFLTIILWQDKIVLSKSDFKVLTLLSNFVLESKRFCFSLRLNLCYSSGFSCLLQKCDHEHAVQLVHLKLFNPLTFICQLESCFFLIRHQLLNCFFSFIFCFFEVSNTLNTLLYAFWRSSF